MSEKPEKSKREIIAECINAGGATMESLMFAADCKYESVMSNFSMLRLMGKCPVKDVEAEIGGKTVLTYRFVSSEEWEQMKAEKSANAGAKRTTVAKSPAERCLVAEKKVARCQLAYSAAMKRSADAAEDTMLALRAEKADVECRIAELELELLTALVENDEEALKEYTALKEASSKNADSENTVEATPTDATSADTAPPLEAASEVSSTDISENGDINFN